MDDANFRRMGALAELDFLDVSFCHRITETGCLGWEQSYLSTLVMNGVSKMTGKGAALVIKANAKTLFDLELVCNDHFEGTEWLKACGSCFSLETLDLTGCTQVDDSALT